MDERTKCLVIHVDVAGKSSERSRSACLAEAVGLAQAIDLDVVEAHIVRVGRVKSAAYIGKGKAQEYAALVAEREITLAIVNTGLSPIQQRNLEKALACKVIDRTALILEIFGERARTAEGKLQVELAALNYQKSRLVRSWTHLERQRGGFGFLGGPGESQIELDRRIISERIDKIKRDLDKVMRTRELHRSKRRDEPYPTIALVGYTNAGKSTLFNRITESNVIARDQLFATLDPTIRNYTLPSGLKILVSDTVGFISDLPTELIAAFRATLEEVLEADLLLHVRDGSHDDSDVQKKDVLQVLASLFGKGVSPPPIIEVLNKSDLGEPTTTAPEAVRMSALTGAGMDELIQAIERTLSDHLLETHNFHIPASGGKAIAWLHSHGKITKQKSDEDGTDVTVRLTSANAARYIRQFT